MCPPITVEHFQPLDALETQLQVFIHRQNKLRGGASTETGPDGNILAELGSTIDETQFVRRFGILAPDNARQGSHGRYCVEDEPRTTKNLRQEVNFDVEPRESALP